MLAGVAREDAGVVISELRELGIPEEGSISLDEIDTQISQHADRAVERAKGAGPTPSSERRSRRA